MPFSHTILYTVWDLRLRCQMLRCPTHLLYRAIPEFHPL